MLAVMIVSIGLTAVIKAYGTCVDVLRVSDDTLASVFLVKEKVSEAELDRTKSSERKDLPPASGFFGAPFGGYGWEIRREPSDIPGLDLNEFKTFRVDEGRERFFEISSYAPQRKVK